jgi:hypothetical protein
MKKYDHLISEIARYSIQVDGVRIEYERIKERLNYTQDLLDALFKYLNLESTTLVPKILVKKKDSK